MIAGSSRVVVRNNGVVIESDNFEVRSPERDSPLLMLTNGEIIIGADILEAMGTRGVAWRDPLRQAYFVRTTNNSSMWSQRLVA